MSEREMFGGHVHVRPTTFVHTYATMLGLMDEINREIERWNLDRAYQVSGIFLTVAGRLPGPVNDLPLSYVLAVRRLATINREPDRERRDFRRAQHHYADRRDETRRWLSLPPLESGESVDNPR